MPSALAAPIPSSPTQPGAGRRSQGAFAVLQMNGLGELATRTRMPAARSVCVCDQQRTGALAASRRQARRKRASSESSESSSRAAEPLIAHPGWCSGGASVASNSNPKLDGELGALQNLIADFAPSPGNNALPTAQHHAPYHPAASAPFSPSSHPATHAQGPPPPANGLSMQHPYDEARRRSLGAAGSPQYGRGEYPYPSHLQLQPSTMLTHTPSGPLEPPQHPPPFPARNMPPPSSPQNAPAPSSHLGAGAPRGPPTASPFAGVRDLASTHRPGMSISAILGGGEERKPNGSPHSSVAAPSHTPKTMQPPSPGRARSASMRESGDRGMRNVSPPRVGIYGEPPRTASEPRRDNIFGSPQFRREPGTYSKIHLTRRPAEQLDSALRAALGLTPSVISGHCSNNR